MTVPEPTLPPVVDTSWLREHREHREGSDGGGVVLADVRWYLDGRSGLDAYLTGHLPGAVWVDVDTVLSAPPTDAAGRHPLPDPDDFAEALGRLGIGDGSTVIAYDDNGGAYAARLVWLLRRTGRAAALLDGGIAAWPDGDLETGRVTPDPVPHTPVDWPKEFFRSADEVASATANGTAVVLDARAPDRYSGATVLPTDIRSGHIPGARNAPWSANLTADGHFTPSAELRAHYTALGVPPDTEVIVYCGSGVTACHDLLALELIGVPTASLYPGSWSAWSADLSRPIETGD
ncbi:sulfurtransferase [Streptomyces sp. NPDC058001]|uniref:sulfurtransferase n=1 Tax=Streptomyces sp. NPDC058001 TaxID=3346300 RepID=UPI0036E1A390